MRPEQSNARYALPGLLVALVIGTLLILVISGSSGEDKKSERAQTTQTVAKPRQKTIRVKAGDNPSSIAERAGIPLETLEELNPRMDPRALHVGDKLKLVP